MRDRRLPIALALTVAASALAAPEPVRAQGQEAFTVALMGGLGGATDAEPDVELSNLGLQALFSMATDLRTLVGVRVGHHRLDAEGANAGPFDTDLTYVNVAGEYRFSEAFYESGLFLGIGLYDRASSPAREGDSALGVAGGVTGEFRLKDRLSVLVELSGHYADLDGSQIFLLGHVGIGYRF